MTTAVQTTTGRLSRDARLRMEAGEGGPFLLSDWLDVLFIHLEADPAALRRQVPFDLDLHEGRAYVSLVAFTIRRLRPCVGGRVLEWLSAPVANHPFLNLRTYVRHGGEPGIYFLAEWLPNPLSVAVGPRVYGLPYRRGKLAYRHEFAAGRFDGRVRDAATGCELRYRARGECGATHAPADGHTLEEFLLERYTAFTMERSLRRRFRVWHEPWAVAPAEVALEETGLLAASGPWFETAAVVGAHHSPGVRDVWIGRPCCIQGPGCERGWDDLPSVRGQATPAPQTPASAEAR